MAGYTALLLALAAAAAVWAGWRLWLLAGPGAAYKAKVLASALFVSGRAVDPDRGEEVSADLYRALRLFRARVDPARREVTVSLLGLRPRTAAFRPGLGAALALGPLAGPPSLPGGPAPDASRPWPDGEAPAPREATPGLARVVEAAFEEPAPRRLRRTRALVVAQGGRLLCERYAPGFSPAAPLCGWSVSKGVLAALVGAAALEGRLALSDKALLPEWGRPGDARAAISVEDLLRMRSGLAFTEVYSDPRSDVVRMLFDSADAAAYAASRPLAAPPGARWAYASGTTNILSRVLRRALGDEAYHAFPRRALFGPLRMTSAVFETDAAGTFVGSSFVHASARDWARFGQLFLADGVWEGRRLLPAGWAAFSAAPTPQSPDGCYGAHWWLKLPAALGGLTAAAARLPADAFHGLGHEGQTLTVVPSRGLVVARLGLSIHIDAWDHARFLADLLDSLPA